MCLRFTAATDFANCLIVCGQAAVELLGKLGAQQLTELEPELKLLMEDSDSDVRSSVFKVMLKLN